MNGISRIAGRILPRLAVTVSCVLALLIFQGGPAGASITFNRAGAILEAQSYWNSYPGTFDHEFEPFTEDCTNFVSYVWQLGGGTAQNADWFDEGVAPYIRDVSNSWSEAQDFVTYQTTAHFQGGQIYASL